MPNDLYSVEVELKVKLFTLVRAPSAQAARDLAELRPVETSWANTLVDEGVLTHWTFNNVPSRVPRTPPDGPVDLKVRLL